MSNERSRHQLYGELREVLSVESADELMSYLPPVGWADVATKGDITLVRNEIDALRAELRGEMAELRGELCGEMGGLRGEMGGLRGELRGEMGELRGELKGDIADLRGHVRAQIAELKDSMRVWTIATMFTLVGLVVAIDSFRR